MFFLTFLKILLTTAFALNFRLRARLRLEQAGAAGGFEVS